MNCCSFFDCVPFPGVFSTSFALLFTGRLTTEIGSGLIETLSGGALALGRPFTNRSGLDA